MSAKRLIRRMDSISTKLYQELIRVESLHDQVDDCEAACDEINLREGPDYWDQARTQEETRKKIERLSLMLSGQMEALQEAAYLVDEIHEALEKLVPPSKGKSYNPPDAWK